MRSISLTTVAIALLFTAGCSDKAPENQPTAPPPPPEVDVSLPVKHNLTDWDEFTGRFEAINDVQVRARVTGYLVEKKFKDGQLVKKGDVLYVIDPRPFEYELQRATAQYELAKKESERARNLRASRAISEEEVDRRFQELQIAQASLYNARLQKNFTNVTSPIDGKISDSYVDVGNMVEENDTLLTRIVSMNPMHFRFEGSQGDLLKYMRLAQSGQRPSSASNPNPIFIKLMDEDKYYHKGEMSFVDNALDRGTGTIQATATVPNDSGLILPGLFGQARLVGRSNYDAILLPENAINTDQDKKFVYVVDTEDKVRRQYVRVGNLLDNELIIITEGLQGDEKVVINGIQRIRQANQPVTPNMTQVEWTEIETLVRLNDAEPKSDSVVVAKQQ